MPIFAHAQNNNKHSLIQSLMQSIICNSIQHISVGKSVYCSVVVNSRNVSEEHICAENIILNPGILKEPAQPKLCRVLRNSDDFLKLNDSVALSRTVNHHRNNVLRISLGSDNLLTDNHVICSVNNLLSAVEYRYVGCAYQALDNV